MATGRIDIIVTETGSRIVRREIEAVGAAAKTTGGHIYSLQQLLLSLVSGVVLTQLGRMSDEILRLKNRFAVLTNDTGRVNAVFTALQDIADETRNSLTATGDVYARMALATRNMGLAANEALVITRALNQAVILSGANVREAEAAMLQFSQGLASGRLAGDELRAVLEQLPLVADIIGEKLGVTRGALRFLAREGKITPEVIVAAFEDAAPRLEASFERTVPTIAQSFVVLHNSVLRLLNRMNDSLGIFKLVTDAVLGLSRHMDTFARVVIAGALTGAVVGATIALNALFAALLANPFTALLAGLTLATSLLFTFSDQITVTEDGMVTLADAFKASVTVIGEHLRLVLEDFKQLVEDYFPGLDRELVKTNGLFGFFVANVDKGFSKIRGLVYGLAAVLDEVFGNNLRSVGETIGKALVAVVVNIFVDALNGFTHVNDAFFRTFEDYAIQYFKEIGAAWKELVASWADDLLSLGDRLVPNFRESDLGLTLGEFSKTLKNDVAAFNRSKKDVQDLFFENLQKSQEEGDLIPRMEVVSVELGRKMKEAFNRGFKEGDNFHGFADLINEIMVRAHALAAIRIEQEKLRKDQEEQARRNLGVPDTPDNRLKTLSQVILDKYTEKLEAEVTAVQGSQREHRVLNELLQEEVRLRQAGVPETTVTNVSPQLESMIRSKVALVEITKDMEKLSEVLPGTQAGFANLIQLRGEFRGFVQEMVAGLELGYINADQFNEALDRNEDRLKRVIGVLGQIKDPLQAYREELEAINRVSKLNLTNLERQNLELAKSQSSLRLNEAQRDPLSGFKAGILSLQIEITDLGKLVQTSLVDAFHSGEDALTDFIVKGKADFRSLAESIASDLVRLGLRQFITGPLMNLAGQYFGGGDLSSSFGGARAGGGPVLPGMDYLVGEDGPEILRMGSTGGQVLSNGDSTRALAEKPVNTTKVTNVRMNVYPRDAGSFKESQRQMVFDMRRKARF